MAHLVFIEDDKGDVIDYIVYCSDFCAKSHPNYAGWNGCHEIDFGERCHCGQAIVGIEDEEA